MSWFKAARDLVVRWGKPVRFAAKHVISAVPGGSLVADMVDKVLACVQETAEDQEQADARMRSQLSDQELQQIAGILAECNGQLADLMQKLVALDGLPDAADEIIRRQRATDKRIEAGFAKLAGFAEQFDRIEAGVGRVEAGVGRLEEQIRQLAERNHVRGDEARRLTVSITNEKEREVLRKLRDEYRKLPPEQQNVESLTLLADSLSAARQFSQAQEMHAEAARRAAAVNKSLAAKNHYQRYRDACELGLWTEALDALLEAARLDPAYRPFSLVQYVPKMILGTGGFGTVLRCEDRYAVAEERAVAVKTLHTADLAREVHEVFAEAHIIKALKHPAIIGVRTWGYFDDDEARPFIVMEYFEGDSLAKHLRQHGKLEPGEAVAIARQVASGMSAAYKARVYHRELNPDNILVRKKGASWEVRLIDFGLAVRQHAASKSVLCPPDSHSASDRSYAGTFKYAPPEQKNEADPISGKTEKVGPYSDVYTFGKTFCEALFGTTAPQSFHYIRLPEQFRPLQQLLERCIADAVAERLADFGEVLAKLDALDPRRREGEALLVQRFREILDRTHGKPAKEDLVLLGKICKEYGFATEQSNAILRIVRSQWNQLRRDRQTQEADRQAEEEARRRAELEQKQRAQEEQEREKKRLEAARLKQEIEDRLRCEEEARKAEEPRTAYFTSAFAIKVREVDEVLGSWQKISEMLLPMLANRLAEGDPTRADRASSLHTKCLEQTKCLQDARKRFIHEMEPPEVVLAVTGSTSSGKSSLVNLLCGSSIMPVGVGNMKAGVVTIHHAPKRQLWIRPTEGANWACGAMPELTSAECSSKEMLDQVIDRMMRGNDPRLFDHLPEMDDAQIHDCLYEIIEKYNKCRGRADEPACPQMVLRYPTRLGLHPELLELPPGCAYRILDLPGEEYFRGDESNRRVIRESARDALCLVLYDSAETDPKIKKRLLDDLARLVANLGGSPARMLFILNRLDVFRRDLDWQGDEQEFVSQTAKAIKGKLREILPEFRQEIDQLQPAKLCTKPAFLALRARKCQGQERLHALEMIDEAFRRLVPKEIGNSLTGNVSRWNETQVREVADSVWRAAYGDSFHLTLKEHVRNHLTELILPQSVDRFRTDAGREAVEWILQLARAEFSSSHERHGSEKELIFWSALLGKAESLYECFERFSMLPGTGNRKVPL